MLILVARYTFFFWIFIGSSNAEKLLLNQIIATDEEFFRLSACTARCLSAFYQQTKYLKETESGKPHHRQKHDTQQESHQKSQSHHHPRKSDLQVCFDKCHSNRSGIAFPLERLRKIQENFHFQLVCRDDRSLTFRIGLENDEATFNDRTFSKEEMKIVDAQKIPKNATHNETYSQNENERKLGKIVYFIRINKASDPEYYRVYLSDENFFTITNLTRSSTYNLTVVATHANNEYSIIAKKEQFSTLRSGYMPGKVKDVQVLSFTAMNDSQLHNRLLTVNIMWTPSKDMTCHYNIICYSTESVDYDMTPFEIRNPRELYTYNIENLSFSKEYKVGIRAKNTNNESKESEFYWATFRAPACVEYYNYNFNICAPLQPQGLHAAKSFVREHEFALNITWYLPEYLPDYYVLKILDLATELVSYVQNVSKHQNTVFIENITLRGIMYEVHLIAYTAGGTATAQFSELTEFLGKKPEKSNKVKLISVIFAPIFCIVVLSLTTFIICQRRAKLKRYEERCKYFEELEKKAPIDPKATFEFPTKALASADDLKQFQLDLEEKIFFYDDAMEIEREDVTLYELLGEGAFGLVRRGVYHNRKSGEFNEVAVKTLKEQPSIDDVRAFRREIEVMKSVEWHPNIIGILGHCTKNSNEIMLLTEYCSLGNLLDFLRNEWKFLNERQPRYISTPEAQKSTLNGNKNKQMKAQNGKTVRLVATNKSYGYDEICTNSCKCQVDILQDQQKNTQIQINPIDEQSNNRQKAIKTITIKNCECKKRQEQQQLLKNNQRNASEKKETLSMDNKGYFQNLNDEEQQQKQQEKQNGSSPTHIQVPRNPLTAADLLDIAKQVATGMEFLAKNKVVHRDLAARNILVTTDRTIKIADFGLSRDIYQENIYKKSGNGKLPIKWLALESMTHQVYTTQSDVWSFGILLFEIATLGGQPYPNIPTNNLLHLLKTGYRISRPQNCGEEFYKLMASCWYTNPSERPTFTEIIKTIDRFICDELTEQQIETAMATNDTSRKEEKDLSISLTDDAYLKPL